MTALKNIVTIVVLSILLAVCFGQVLQGGPYKSQGGPHQYQGRTRRQIPQNVGQVDNIKDHTIPDVWQNPQNWTTCDFTAVSKISCHNCNTRIICKPIGGLLKSCNNPNKPYCNSGICSAIASPDCV
ncbi:unnamed protein product [Euphydryas editha]|uniref:Uncharacterized protein n=1 Tax=Euphydryas editha TaxID=104508 RepID=A0AAU9U7S1_EUPED|nr:unnamed protein product [Euphydryas editha]